MSKGFDRWQRRLRAAREHRDWLRDYLYGHDWPPAEFNKLESMLWQAECQVEARV